MDLFMDELRKDRYEKLYNYLLQFYEQGAVILVNGQSFSVEKAASIMTLNEKECYMPDFEWDEYGNIILVNYDLVMSY